MTLPLADWALVALTLLVGPLLFGLAGAWVIRTTLRGPRYERPGKPMHSMTKLRDISDTQCVYCRRYASWCVCVWQEIDV